MADRVVRLSTEDRGHLVDALEDADHDLLVELRALRQVGALAEVVDGKDVGPALGGGGNKLGRLDFGKAAPVQRLAEGRHHGGGEAKDCPALRVAVDRDGVVQLRRQPRLDLALADQHRQRLAHRLQHGDGGILHLDAAGGLRRGGCHALDADHALRQHVGSDHRLQPARLVDHHLRRAPAIAQDDKRNPAQPAHGVQGA